MQWLGILFSWCPQVVLESTALITVFTKNTRISIFGKCELSGGFTATWKTVSSHNKSLFIRFANLGIFDK